MKIKRYFAADMRQAIRLVREEQGPDAVILSNRKVNGGVEIVAAVDYDESLVRKMAGEEPHSAARPQTAPEPAAPRLGAGETVAPRRGGNNEQFAEAVAASLTRKVSAPEPAPVTPPLSAASKIEWSQDPALRGMREEIKTLRGMLESQLTGMAWRDQTLRHPARAKLMQRLLQLGLAPALCRQLADKVSYEQDHEHHWRHALGLLARRIQVTEDDILSRGGMVALVGPTGVGKTTTVAKLAARYILRHGPNRVALVTTDSFRIGAHQQLRTYGRLLGVPVHVANDAAELRTVLDTLRDKQLVLIDTAGVSQRDMRLTEQLSLLRQGAPRVKNYLVLSATAQRAALDETVRTFRHMELAGCVITKMDEAASLGEVLSAVVQQKLPVAYVSDGQRVPEDLHQARANKLVSGSVALMQTHSAEVPGEEVLAEAFGRRVS
ncbi:flagellar biosynthesis protein FlhF [Sulfurivermis fontis]|uniref:flagellar biosynthesis protein FlhF n=1 Tax=Sulfurivermis fontis TaxID=1972068 RepID=UPI000FDA5F48|nr:flagellar biosynthesis protein FlhF [Sulfurivermis fontis]